MQKISQFSFHFRLYSGAFIINNQVINFSHSTEKDRKKATGKEKVKPLLKLTEKNIVLKAKFWLVSEVKFLILGVNSRADTDVSWSTKGLVMPMQMLHMLLNRLEGLETYPFY